MIESILIENGLSDKEAKLYLTVLEAGEAPIGQLAKKSNLKRTTLYTVVESLEKRNILYVSKRKGVQYVSALPPRVLIERFKQSAQMAENMLPQLMDMAYASPLKPRMQFFEGLNGLKDILREFSYSSQPSFVFTDYAQMPAELFAYIRKEIVPEREKRKIFTKLIVPNNERNQEVKQEDHLHYGEHRLVQFPESHNQNPIEILLFEDSKIGFLSFTSPELFGVILDSKAVYQTLKNLFLLVWSTTEMNVIR